jgi:hypothetical protein
MEKIVEAYDCNNDLFYIVIKQGESVETLIDCYAFRKKKFLWFFSTREYITDPDCDSSFNKRCNSYTTVDVMNKEGVDKKLNYLIDKITEQVNNVIKKTTRRKEILNLLFK